MLGVIPIGMQRKLWKDMFADAQAKKADSKADATSHDAPASEMQTETELEQKPNIEPEIIFEKDRKHRPTRDAAYDFEKQKGLRLGSWHKTIQ